MKHFIKWLAVGLFVLPGLVYAHGAPRLQVEESIIINADAATVWNTIKNFDSPHTWLDAIKSTEAKGGNEKGATRTLTLDGGATINETLKKFDEEKMSLMYQIDAISSVGEIDDHGHPHEVPAVPVSKLKGWLTVESVAEGTKVTWLAKFFRAYHGKHEPPAQLGDKAATDAMSGFFKTGLAGLKAKLEK